MPVLILGYQLDQIERISQILLIYLAGDHHIWAPIDLGDIASSNRVPITPASSEELIVTVKPDKKKGKEKISL